MPMKPQTKQDEIVKAAQELFTTFGFEKTTMTDIAKRIGISKASLYYYFNDKEGIIQLLARQEQDQFISEIQDITSDISLTSEKLHTYSNKRIELLQRHLTLSSTNLGTFASIRTLFSSILHEFRQRETALVTDILKNGIARQEIRALDAPTYAELFLEVLRGFRKNAFYNSEKNEAIKIPASELERIKQQSALFVEIFTNGISK